MYPNEDVLRDLLLEHGIEGVTLWHIRCLAAYVEIETPQTWRSARLERLGSDLRGEDAVRFEAEAHDKTLSHCLSSDCIGPEWHSGAHRDRLGMMWHG
jgi:hypothetical protein